MFLHWKPLGHNFTCFFQENECSFFQWWYALTALEMFAFVGLRGHSSKFFFRKASCAALCFFLESLWGHSLTCFFFRKRRACVSSVGMP